MHNQETNVSWSLASGEFQKVGIFSPSFPSGAEWSCASAGNPQGGMSLRSPLPTPRRKLSLDILDDSTQSPPSMESIDSAYASSPDKENSRDQVYISPANKSSNRRPFESINSDAICSPRTRRTLCARRPKAQKKLSLTLCTDKAPSHSSRPLSLPSSISPLAMDFRTGPFLRQISLPLERMSLASPHSSQSSLSQPSAHNSESDGYNSDVFDNIEETEENHKIPRSISELINGPLAKDLVSPTAPDTLHTMHHPTPCRPESDTITSQRRGSIKRSFECSEERTCKRQMAFLHSSNSQPTPSPQRKATTLFRSQSMYVESTSIFPTSPGDGGVEMIGDYSKPYALPLIKGSQPDQKNIAPQTLVSLIQGEYSDLVDRYTIIDCRYPFEYRGGHIKDSVNIWDKDSLLSSFFDSPMHPLEGKRQIIIFHCEFSSKRGPNMSRFMRKTDRERNGMDFPKLFYPELYLLEGGYRAFFGQHPNHCDPCAYLQMKDDRYQEEAKHFSRRSKSWSEGGGRRPLLRPRLATVGSLAHTNK